MTDMKPTRISEDQIISALQITRDFTVDRNSAKFKNAMEIVKNSAPAILESARKKLKIDPEISPSISKKSGGKVKKYMGGGKVKKYMGGGKVYASHNKRYSHGGKVSGRKATYKY